MGARRIARCERILWLPGGRSGCLRWICRFYLLILILQAALLKTYLIGLFSMQEDCYSAGESEVVSGGYLCLCLVLYKPCLARLRPRSLPSLPTRARLLHPKLHLHLHLHLPRDNSDSDNLPSPNRRWKWNRLAVWLALPFPLAFWESDPHPHLHHHLLQLSPSLSSSPEPKEPVILNLKTATVASYPGHTPPRLGMTPTL